MKKIAALVLCLAMLGTTLLGCQQAPANSTGGTTSNPASAVGGVGKADRTINVCIGPEPETIDPAKNNSVDGYAYVATAFEGLYKLNEKNEVVNGQAKEVKTSEDKLVWTITLRDDIKWSDGQPVTAEDFVYSWQRAASPETASDYALLYEVIKNGKDVIAGNKPVTDLGVKAVDEKTIEVTLEAVCPYFDKLLAFPTFYPVRKDVTEGNDGWTQDAKSYVGNGPMMMTAWNHKESLIYTKNPNYYDADKVTNSTLKFTLLEDDNAKMSAYENKELDFIFDLPVDDVDTLKERPDYLTLDNSGTYYVAFQNQKAPLDDVKVRQALSLAIDRNFIVDKINKKGTAANAFVSPYISGIDGGKFREQGRNDYYSVKPEDYEANCEKARQLLAEAGYPEGKGFPKFEYMTNPTSLHIAIAEALQNMWKTELGIECTVVQQEWAVFLDTRPKGDFNVCRDGWVPDYDDPSSFLDIFISYNGNNDAHLKNDELDKLMEQTKGEFSGDEQKRQEILHQVEDIVMDNWVMAPVFFYQDNALSIPELKGFYSLPNGLKAFWNAYVEG